MKFTGIILSGGRSLRMGKDKGLCRLNGKPLIEYSYNILINICDPVIISANSDDYNYLGCRVVRDIEIKRGPAGGIYSSLLASGTKENVVLSCDMPFVTIDLMRYLMTQTEDYDAVIPVYNGNPEPLCGLYKRRCKTVFSYSIKKGIYKILRILESLKVNYVTIDPSNSFYHPCLFTNVNTPEDIKMLENNTMQF